MCPHGKGEKESHHDLDPNYEVRDIPTYDYPADRVHASIEEWMRYGIREK